MSILTIPESWEYAEAAEFLPVANTLNHTSPLDGTSQTVEMPGHRWMIKVSFGPYDFTQDKVAEWKVFLVSLRGTSGRFYVSDPQGTTPRGEASTNEGTPLVNGASQTGSSLNIDGCPNSVINYLKKGDYLSISYSGGNKSLHIVSQNVDTNGSGEATVSIEPPIRDIPDDDAEITLTNPTCVMQMIDNDQTGWIEDTGGQVLINFEAVETYA